MQPAMLVRDGALCCTAESYKRPARLLLSNSAWDFGRQRSRRAGRLRARSLLCGQRRSQPVSCRRLDPHSHSQFRGQPLPTRWRACSCSPGALLTTGIIPTRTTYTTRFHLASQPSLIFIRPVSRLPHRQFAALALANYQSSSCGVSGPTRRRTLGTASRRQSHWPTVPCRALDMSPPAFQPGAGLRVGPGFCQRSGRGPTTRGCVSARCSARPRQARSCVSFVRDWCAETAKYTCWLSRARSGSALRANSKLP